LLFPAAEEENCITECLVLLPRHCYRNIPESSECPLMFLPVRVFVCSPNSNYII